MQNLISLSWCGLLLLSSAHLTDEPAVVAIDTTLSTDGGQIRQFAFDGDPTTYFASDRKLRRADHFTLVFDKPVAASAIMVVTGQPDGSDRLERGSLEVADDGSTFVPITAVEDGMARVQLDRRLVQAVRIKAVNDLEHSLVIREFTIDSVPPVATFKYPIEFIVDVTDAPEMKEWAMRVARICERAYPMINEELKTDGFKPRHVITMTLKNDYRGVAATSGGRITGSVKFFKDHADDVGAMVHETVHCVQSYRARNNPGWLVEGVADYVRFFKFEPGKLRPLDPERVRYNGSYRITAQFLAYLVEHYDREIVLKLNRIMREGQYGEDVWENLTGKPVEELDEEWRASLRR